jgi:hypothetical protein
MKIDIKDNFNYILYFTNKFLNKNNITKWIPTLKDQTAHIREATTINLNLLSKYQMMILRLKFAYHISKIYLKIYRADLITQLKELTKYHS